MDKVAVVILNWNGCDMLRRFLPSVLRHSAGEGSVWVADNGSSDGSSDMLRREFPQVRVIQLDGNYGYAGGYNRALRQVEAQYAVLLNSDVEVTPHWLAPLTAFMDSHPDVAACQPKVLSLRRRTAFEYAGACGGYMDRYGYPFCRGRVMGATEEDRGQYDDACYAFWATGAAMFVRMDDFREAGGLDDGFFAHMEEIDLCWRFRARGRRVACVPQSTVYHLGAATLKRENPKKTFLNFRNNLLMLYKNLPERELRRVMAVRCVLDHVAALQYALKLQPANAVAVLKARRAYHRMKPDYEAKRRENLAKAVTERIEERMDRSLIVQYCLLGRKTFSALYCCPLKLKMS